MRIVLSRKGFDSRYGGCASPIFPDGSMLALPIPDDRSTVRYRDIEWRRRNVGDLVERLTRGRVGRGATAHLDPDLRRGDVPRAAGWRAAFGQCDAAQGHLRNASVGVGDLFLYWGLFRRVDADLRPVGPRVNVVWGWLQVGAVLAVDRDVRARLASRRWRWAADHPHLAAGRFPSATNTLYVASDDLALPGRPRGRRLGAGTFDLYDDALRLTAEGATAASRWSLPRWFLPRGRPPLSFHAEPSRWSRAGERTSLRVTSPGQEFVLDADAYPEAIGWAAGLVEGRGMGATAHGGGTPCRAPRRS